MKDATAREIGATAEIMGVQLSEAALEIMLADLDGYPDESILKAIRRVRKDGTRFTLAEIIKRLPNMWPGAEQAWAMFPKHEDLSACVCQEMSMAWGVSCQLDEVAGRMAFKETYNRAVSEAMSDGRQPTWFITCGTDKQQLEEVTMQAVTDGKITADHAHRLLPHYPMDEMRMLAMGEKTMHKVLEDNAAKDTNYAGLLEGPEVETAPPEVGQSHLAEIRNLLKG